MYIKTIIILTNNIILTKNQIVEFYSSLIDPADYTRVIDSVLKKG